MINYVSLIMDIEKSKMYSIEERNEMQQYMDKCIQNLNSLFLQKMQFEVTFSAGDEMQGLFDDVTAALLYFRLFEMLVKPAKVRAGIGVGGWTVKIAQGLSTQQDGPAYHNARKAIEEVYIKQLQNIRICSKSNDTLVNHLINASLPLKEQQVYMQNMVQVIVELLFPFVTKGGNPEGHLAFKKLLSLKFDYRLSSHMRGMYPRRNLMFEQNSINFEVLPISSPIIIDGIVEEMESAILRKNTSTIISEILGCSRQNVDSIMKRGNSNKIRELDYMALQYAENIYGGTKWN